MGGVVYLLLVFGLPHVVPAGGYKIEPFLVAHNVFLSALSAVMFVGCAVELFRRVRSDGVEWLLCEKSGIPASGRLYFWSYCFYVSKLYELLDSVLVVLRGSKLRHFWLHIYHHTIVPVMIWWWLQTCMSLQFVGLLWNSFVHIIMYCYYARAALQMPTSWKKWVTRLQLLQFASSVPFAFVIFPKIKDAPFGDQCAGQGAMWVNFAFNLSLLFLFLGVHKDSNLPPVLEEAEEALNCNAHMSVGE